MVEPDALPPETIDCIEDWIRLPADERDIAARLEALSARASQHRPVPVTDERGRLLHRNRSTLLSPTELRLASALVQQFGQVVSSEALMAAAWPHTTPSAGALRVNLTRLRKTIEPLGLEIWAVRAYGYVLQDQRGAAAVSTS